MEKDLEHRTGNTNFGYGSRQTRILKLRHDEIYEIKRSAILFDDGKGYTLYSLPKVTRDEIRRYGPLVSWGLPHEDDPEKRIDWLLELLERGGFDRHTFLGPFVFTKGKLFFGLLGGFSEGEGNFGGLAVFDLSSSHTWEVIRHPLLIDSHVTDINFDSRRETFWIGTTNGGEGIEFGLHGLVQYNLSTQKWASYTTKNSEISGDIVRMVKSYTRYLWVSTENGISRLEPKKGTWKNFRWKQNRVKGDSLFELVETP